MKIVLCLFYLLIGPVLASAISDRDARDPLTFGALLGGLLVGLIHLRQATTRGRWGVFIGTALAWIAAIMLWFFSLLALAFASDSGRHLEQINSLFRLFTAGLAVVAPAVGALLGALVARASARRPTVSAERKSPGS
ncbi:hypothetical protein DYH09_03890 [bacterium CPR1]|nr:hypothetical protein [bacterium CPR1]